MKRDAAINTTVDRSMDFCRPVDTCSELGKERENKGEMGRDGGEGYCESDGY